MSVHSPGRGARSAEAQRAYRQRIKDGEWVPTPKPPPVLPPAVVLSTAEVAELEDAWQREYERTVAAWLLRQRSDKTRRCYRAAWAKWVGWCEEHDIDHVDPPHGTGGVFLAAMREAGYSEATRHQWRVAIRQAMIDLSINGLRAGGDPFARVPGERISDVSSTVPITDDVVRRLIDGATECGGQHRTAVLMLAVMGLRAFEAGQITSKTVRRSPWGWVADIVGKGHKRALVPIPDIVREAAAIDGWPMEREKDGQRVARKSRTSGYERIYYLLRQASERAGVDVSPHQLRHWHATVALREGVPLERVQDSLRHADPATTQRYNRARVIVEGHSAFTVAALPAIKGGE